MMSDTGKPKTLRKKLLHCCFLHDECLLTGPEAPQCEDSIKNNNNNNNNRPHKLLAIHKKEEIMDVYMKEGYRRTDLIGTFPVHDYCRCACKE
jgi:hypothetical protein